VVWKNSGLGVERRTPDPETAGSNPTRYEIRRMEVENNAVPVLALRIFVIRRDHCSE
jgi:hypothetical protein